ncbi:MAG: DUF1801 domain-containing protein [Ignavibacteriales bacterium]|nr:DUF1801 domain-containing protein [Ignavibacteriales bacterium]
MPTAENKTKPTSESADTFLNKVQDTQKRKDCFEIMKLMQAVTKEKPVMWGSAIIGFGSYHYVYESGREGGFLFIGFAPRKQNISIYLMGGLKAVQPELSKLGKYKIGGGCLYIKSLSDVNTTVLKKIFAKAFKEAQHIKGCTI